MWEHIGVIAAVSAFALHFLCSLIGGFWKLSRVEMGLREAIERERQDIDNHIDRQGREFGETASALREKIREVELFTRDTFLRQDSFYKAQDELKTAFGALGFKIEARLERMETKIDNKT